MTVRVQEVRRRMSWAGLEASPIVLISPHVRELPKNRITTSDIGTIQVLGERVPLPGVFGKAS